MARLIAPLARVTMNDDQWFSGDGILRSVEVLLGEDERASTCSFSLFDDGLKIGAKYFDISFKAGGIEVPPDLLKDPNATAATGAAAGSAGATTGTANATGATGDALAREIIAECERQGITDKAQIAYVLATVERESAMGVYLEEIASGAAYEGRSDLGNSQPGDGVRFKGRGYVQITGRTNYQRYSEILGIDLVGNPERASDPEIAMFTLVHGMKNGIFTGKALSDYGTDGNFDYVNARRIINGTDKANLIAGYAETWYSRIDELRGGAPAPAPQPTADEMAGSTEQPGIKDKAATKPEEVSEKGTEIIIEIGFSEGAMTSYHFIHTGTQTSGFADQATTFEGKSIRWTMNRRIKNTAYQEVTLKQIAERVAENQGVTLEMDGDGPKFQYVDQTGISDYELLLREAKNAGYFVREKKGTLEIKRLSEESFAAYVIDRQIVKSISFNDQADADRVMPPPSNVSIHSAPATAASEATATINRDTGQVQQNNPEDTTGTGREAGAATTGAPATRVGGTVKGATDAPGETVQGQTIEVAEGVIVDRAAVIESQGGDTPADVIKFVESQGGPEAIREREQKKKDKEAEEDKNKSGTATTNTQNREGNQKIARGYESSATVLTTPDALLLEPGSIIGISKDIVPDPPFAREWRVNTVRHKLNQGQLETEIAFYTPVAVTGQSAAPAATTAAAGNVPPGSWVNPMPGAPVGDGVGPRSATRNHNGYDLQAPGPVGAANSGTVIESEDGHPDNGNGANGGWGNTVVIEHADSYFTRYAHLKQGTILVKVGDVVESGQKIADSGNSGGSQGVHLHWEIRRNSARGEVQLASSVGITLTPWQEGDKSQFRY